jgi:hypothetical protein
MLTMGAYPGVVSVTSSAMMVCTTFASATSFSMFGLVLPDFAITGFIVGFSSSYIESKAKYDLTDRMLIFRSRNVLQGDKQQQKHQHQEIPGSNPGQVSM